MNLIISRASTHGEDGDGCVCIDGYLAILWQPTKKKQTARGEGELCHCPLDPFSRSSISASADIAALHSGSTDETSKRLATSDQVARKLLGRLQELLSARKLVDNNPGQGDAEAQQAAP